MEQDDQNLLCDYCGVVFARIGALHDSTPVDSKLTVYAPAPRAAGAWLRSRLFTPQESTNRMAFVGRTALLLALAAWGAQLVSYTIESNGAGQSFLHLVNTPFHEAGHVFFTPFGDFVRTLGGTLGQLIMPMVCCLVLLLKTRDPFGAGVALWWFGENFLDIAPYIDDAGTGELPLLGGNTGESTPYGFHDWEYLLTETNRLGHEHDMARMSHTIGACIMALALVWMAAMLWRSYQAGRPAYGPGTLRSRANPLP
jgi:hypothetical protein